LLAASLPQVPPLIQILLIYEWWIPTHKGYNSHDACWILRMKDSVQAMCYWTPCVLLKSEDIGGISSSLHDYHYCVHRVARHYWSAIISLIPTLKCVHFSSFNMLFSNPYPDTVPTVTWCTSSWWLVLLCYWFFLNVHLWAGPSFSAACISYARRYKYGQLPLIVRHPIANLYRYYLLLLCPHIRSLSFFLALRRWPLLSAIEDDDPRPSICQGRKHRSFSLAADRYSRGVP
jgi:hypothetical protein